MVSGALRDQQPKSILVIKPSSFGDVVHTLPAVALLKRAWPNAHLTWVINPEWSPLLQGNLGVDTILPFPRREFRGWKAPGKFLRWCKKSVAPLRPDLTVDFQGLFRSAWIGRHSRATNYVGMPDAREGARWFYPSVAPPPPGTAHAVERYLSTAEFACRLYGSQGVATDTDKLPWPLPPGQAVGAVERSVENDFLLFHPFSRGRGKSLSVDEVKQICSQVAPRPVVLVGHHPGTRIEGLPANCLDLFNQTSLPQLIWLIRKSAFVITVDSGPSHLAAALKRPMVAIHTWSDPRLVGPFWKKAWVWKGGVLRQMQELSKTSFAGWEPRPVGLQARDLEAISALAISS